jgi:O-antigen/teichoic acid export membrane protein
MSAREEPEPRSMSEPSLRSRLVSNATVSLVSYALYLPVALFISRYTVHRVGLETYGIWAALTGIMAFSALLNLGITVPVIKYTAEYTALHQARDINALLSTTAVFYFVLSTMVAAIGLLFSQWIIVHIFHQNAHDPVILRAYIGILVGLVILLTFTVLQSCIVGLQRADINAAVALAMNVEGALGTVVVLQLGLGLSGLVLNWLVTTILTVVVVWIVAKRLLPSLRISPFLCSRDQFRKIFAFSARMQITSLALFLNDQVDRVLVAYALGPAPLGYYQLAARASQTISGVSYSLMSGSLSAASDLAATENWPRFRDFFIRSSRYVAIVDFGACFCVGTLAHPLVGLWLGPGYERVASTAMIILAGYAFFLPVQATHAALNAVGHPEIGMRADLAFLFIHIPLSATLLWRFGFFGTVIGTAIAISSTRLYLYWAGSRFLGIGSLTLVRQSFLHPFIAALLAALSAFVVSSPIHSSLVALILGLVVFSTVFVAYTFTLALDSYDRRLARSYANRLLQLLPRVWRVLT